MSTEVQSIVEAARGLNPEQRLELVTALASLHSDGFQDLDRQRLVHSIWGKYSYVPTSSDEFNLRKAEDVASESRP